MKQKLNRSVNATSASQTKNLAKSADVLVRHFRKWVRIFPNQPVNKQALLVYLEALNDLSPNQIDAGCTEAIKTAEQFPKPGHIRNAVPHENYSETLMLGPPMLEYNEPPLTEEEKQQAAEDSAKLRKLLEPIAQMPPEEPEHTEAQRRIYEQMKILKEKGFLQ